MRFFLAALLLLPIAPRAAARTLLVLPDGAGSTIQAALDAAAPGDTVLVACGTYFESLAMRPGVALRSATGAADCVTIDAGGAGRGILCDGVDASSLIEGITFTGGSLAHPCEDPGLGAYCMGAGMLCIGSSPLVRRCVFAGNESDDNGGGVTCVYSSPTFVECEIRDNAAHVGGGFVSAFPPGEPVLVHCVIAGNAAETDGGGVYVYDTALSVSGCTITGNSAGEDGGGIFWISGATLAVEQTIVSHSSSGEAIHCGLGASVPELDCSDLFGNAGGDWLGCIAAEIGVAQNFSADPLFCDPDGGELTLEGSSPCAPSGPCALVGALGVGCVATAAPAAAVQSTSWGAVKTRYR
jgi:hypothetical protein